jgi:hypothetical protein
MYIAYVLSNNSLNKLKQVINQDYPDLIAHHITYKFGVKPTEAIPPETDEIYVIGVASQDGVQALLVSINGQVERSDGSLYHITWSIDKSAGKKPVDSNKIIHRAKMISPIKIEAYPKLLK